MAAGTQYDKNLNMDATGIKTPAFYDSNLDEWLMYSAAMVKTAAGLWVALQLDANGHLKTSIKDASTLESKLTTANTALGTPGDQEAEGDGSLIAIAKRLRTLLAEEPVVLSATIGSGQSISGEIDLHGAKYLAFCLPASIDDATTLSFLAYNPALADFARLDDDEGAEVTITVSAGRVISIDVAALKLAPISRLKIRLGTEAAPVTATEDRTIYVSAKR